MKVADMVGQYDVFDTGEYAQLKLMKGFTGEKRVWLGAELYEMVKQLIRDGLKARYSDWTNDKIDAKLQEIITPWFKKKH